MPTEDQLTEAWESLWTIWQAVPPAVRSRNEVHYRNVEGALRSAKFALAEKASPPANDDKAPVKAKR